MQHNLSKQSIFDRYMEEVEDFTEGLENEDSTGIFDITIAPYLAVSFAIFLGLLSVGVLYAILCYFIGSNYDYYFDFLSTTQYLFIVAALWFVLIYFYQKYRIKILYQKAAYLYFSKGIEQAFRQLHICRKELNAKDFKSLLDEKLKDEWNLD